MDDGSGAASACCCAAGSCPSAGWGAAATDSGGAPDLSGSCSPTFDGALSNSTITGSGVVSSICRGDHSHRPVAASPCTSSARTTAIGGMCTRRAGAKLATLTIHEFYVPCRHPARRGTAYSLRLKYSGRVKLCWLPPISGGSAG